MENLAEEKKELGRRNACAHLDCGEAYRLICAIESEIEQLSERIDKELRGQDSTIEGLKKDILDVYEVLAQRTKRIEALEKPDEKIIEQGEKIEELGRCNDQAHERLHLHSGRIEALEGQIKPAILFTMTEPVVKDNPPTDKDGKPKFQVRDTIAFYDNDVIRIVLGVKQNPILELMYVPSGIKYTTCSPELYTLVYRPGSPKPEGTNHVS